MILINLTLMSCLCKEYHISITGFSTLWVSNYMSTSLDSFMQLHILFSCILFFLLFFLFSILFLFCRLFFCCVLFFFFSCFVDFLFCLCLLFCFFLPFFICSFVCLLLDKSCGLL